jgi:hypothetical protein
MLFISSSLFGAWTTQGAGVLRFGYESHMETHQLESHAERGVDDDVGAKGAEEGLVLSHRRRIMRERLRHIPESGFQSYFIEHAEAIADTDIVTRAVEGKKGELIVFWNVFSTA